MPPRRDASKQQQPTTAGTTTTSSSLPGRPHYIVVGAGPAGCVLASVLASASANKGSSSSQRRRRVVLLEQGHTNLPPQQPHATQPQQRPGDSKASKGPVGGRLHDRAVRLLRDPAGWGRAAAGYWTPFGGDDMTGGFQRSYLSTPQAHLGGRQFYHPRGVGAGGCSLINATQYGRGYMEDYQNDGDHDKEEGGGEEWCWPSGEGWSLEEIKGSFERVESQLSLVECPTAGPVAQAYAHAATQAGLVEGASGPGVFLTPNSYSPMTYMMTTSISFSPRPEQTKKEGEQACYFHRQTTYDAFVAPLLLPHIDQEEGGDSSGGGLEVMLGVLVHRVIIRQGRAVGVVYSRQQQQAGGGRGNNKKQEVVVEEELLCEEGGEVVLCAGALETPRVLMLSGIGEREHLEGLGIEVLVDCPHVGRGLKDHMLAPVQFMSRRVMRPEWQAPNAIHGWVNILHTQPKGARSQLLAFDNSMATDILIECFLPRYPWLWWRVLRSCLAALSWLLLVVCPPLAWWLNQCVVGYLVCVMNGKSEGTVRLTNGTDPTAPLHLDPQSFSHPDDVACLALGLRWARALLRSHPLALREVLPSTLLVPDHPPPQQHDEERRSLMKGGKKQEEEEDNKQKATSTTSSTTSTSSQEEEEEEVVVSHVEAQGVGEAELRGVFAYASLWGGTYFHPVGTCRLGQVTDGRARVKGLPGGGLRVADVSLLGRTVGAGTVAVAMMIGDRVARLILQDQEAAGNREGRSEE